VDGDGDGPDKTTVITLTMTWCDPGATLGAACYHPEADLYRESDDVAWPHGCRGLCE